jgi:hypothetical protein
MTMDNATYQRIVHDGQTLLVELKADGPGYFIRLVERFDDPQIRAALFAAYEIGHEDGESEREMYPDDYDG